MELEEELDRKLFVRTNKKVILTEEGVLFQETAEDILKLYNRARADHTGQSELDGEIYIACGEIESFDLVAGKIRDFHLNHPKVALLTMRIVGRQSTEHPKATMHRTKARAPLPPIRTLKAAIPTYPTK